MAVRNCSICLDPLSGGSTLPQILEGPYQFPCKHTIHRACLVRWTDQMHIEQPEKKTLSCPECRAVTAIPTKHSAEQIADWVKIAPKAFLS